MTSRGAQYHIELRKICARDWFWSVRDFFLECTLETGHAISKELARRAAKAAKNWHVKQEKKRAAALAANK